MAEQRIEDEIVTKDIVGNVAREIEKMNARLHEIVQANAEVETNAG